MNLLIVESPGKVRKIQEFLGRDFKVMASIGHVRDLPVREMGVAAPDFIPEYIPTDRGKKVLAELNAAAKRAEKVYLATDPDREGEAIAWHVAEALNLVKPERITYTEITGKAVKEALKKSRPLDMNLVSAQEGRRVLDRLVGYMVSPELSRAEGGRLSAGRVQSPALRLVVEREEAIRNFQLTTHYGVELTFEEAEKAWKAQWNTRNWLEKGQEYLLDKELAQRVAAIKDYTVAGYEESINKQAPPAPFTTSTLQQAASVALKLNPKKSMELAQKLYEAGHITYMRTDSPNLGEEAVKAARSFAAANNWEVPAKPRTWKSKESAQEAHEAIRPTHFEAEAAGNTAEEKALYKLIRIRALASQLMDAEYAVTSARLEAELAGKPLIFEAKGKRLTKPGFKIIMAADQTDENLEAEADNPVPKLQEGRPVSALESRVQTKKTKAPARFTEAALVKELEKRGIGRPSTYAAILDNIISREYVILEKRQLVATELGEKIIKALFGKFKFLEFDFTKDLEEGLDLIAEGKADYLSLMTAAHRRLAEEIKKFTQANFHQCPDCGRALRHLIKEDTPEKRGYNFWSCSGYPECKTVFADHGGQPGKRREYKAPAPLSEHKCPDCGKPLRNLVKEATEDNRGYNFWSCSGFPDCRASLPDDNGRPGVKAEIQKTKYKCPACEKNLIRRRGVKNGKNYDFYGCSGFPDCRKIYAVNKDGEPKL